MRLDIIGRTIQLAKRNADNLKGLNMGERLSFDFYDGQFRGVKMIFVKPKRKNPTPRKCTIIAERLSHLFGLPIVFILAPAMAYERQRLMEKDVFFVMSGKYANLPMMVAIEKASSRKMPSQLTPVAQYLLLYHLQVEKIDGKAIKEIASLMPYSYESVSQGLTCLSDLGLAEKAALDYKKRTISFKYSGRKLWEKAGKFMIDPVKRRIFCDEIKSSREFPACGISALALFSSLNPDPERWIMMTVKEYKEINADELITNPNEFDGKIVIEIWQYPPVGPKGETKSTVDKLSLALSLKHDDDPRVEEEIEQMINRLQWSD